MATYIETRATLNTLLSQTARGSISSTALRDAILAIFDAYYAEQIVAMKGLTQNSQSTAYVTVQGDANGMIYHPSSDNNPRTFTIAANGSVAYPIGTTLTFINEINTVTIGINTDTLVLSSSGSTGNRTLAANGVATAIKVGTTRWVIYGTGLT